MYVIERLSGDGATKQFMRYFFAGGVAFSVDMSVLIILKGYVGVNYLVAAAVAFMIGLTVSYIICIKWVFNQRRLSDKRHEFFLFVLVGICGLGITEVIMWFATEIQYLHYTQSKVVAAAIVFLFNFGARKILLFTARRPRDVWQ